MYDDNKDVADSLAFLLETEGHEVKTAYDGSTALEMAWAELPDVVLLDIGMPKMDGYTLAQEFLQNSGLRRPLSVAMTGYGSHEDMEKSHASGFDAHLVKPVDIEALRKLLTNYQTSCFHCNSSDLT